MDFFEEAALRLKQQLKTTQDKVAAAALGLSAQSWAGRKKRGNFPEKELRALAQRRPELGIDVEYVLTGGRLSAHERAEIARAQRLTAELPGLSEAERAGLAQLAGDAGVQAARNSALLAPVRQRLQAVAESCQDGNNLALLLALAERLAEGERARAALAGRAAIETGRQR